jgi:hypothetical protein
LNKKNAISKRIFFGTALVLVSLILAALPMNVSAQPVEDWVARYDGPAHNLEYVNGLEMDSKGNIYIAVQSIGIGTQTDFTLVSFDPDGNLRWVNRYNGPNNYYESVWSMTMGPDEKLYMVGVSGDPNIDYNCITAAYDTDGNRLWLRIYESPEGYYEWAGSIAVDPSSGNVYIAGWITTVANNQFAPREMLTIAYDSSGNELWVDKYSSPGLGLDMAYGIAVHPITKEIIVAGSSAGSGTGLDATLIAYKPDGTISWVDTYDNPKHTDDRFGKISIAPDGNMYISGSVNIDFISGDTLLAAYSSAGNQLWIDTYNGPGDGSDMGTFITLDYPDRVYVSGYSTGIGTGTDYTILSYDLSGNQQWVARYDGPANSVDWAFRLLVTPAGNIYVTGFSTGIGTSHDHTTLAFDPDGNLLWELRYNGPANGIDRCNFIDLDPLGNIYIAGFSTGIGTSFDATVVKYSVNNEEAIENLIDFVNDMDISAGIKNSLGAKLENVQKAFEKGNHETGLNILQAFINEVEAQSGNKLSETEANQLIYAAQWLIENL